MTTPLATPAMVPLEPSDPFYVYFSKNTKGKGTVMRHGSAGSTATSGSASESVYIHPSIKVVRHPIIGRLLITSEPIAMGVNILSENAYIYGSWEEYLCPVCDEEHQVRSCSRAKSAYPSALFTRIEEVEECMTEFEGIEDRDRARTLIKCLLAFRSIAASSSKLSLQSPHSEFPSFIQPLLSMAAANFNRSLQVIRTLRNESVIKKSKLLPSFVEDDVLAHILSALNTNSHEIGAPINGSALYLRGSLFQHACLPNCNFTSTNVTLSVYTTMNIPANTPLTIDYASALYQPTHIRQALLYRTHAFVCTCDVCNGTVADRARAFKCEHDGCKGIVFASGRHLVDLDDDAIEGEPDDDMSDDHSYHTALRNIPNSNLPWSCTACKSTISEKQRELYLWDEKECVAIFKNWLDIAEDDGEEFEEEDVEEEEMLESLENVTIREESTSSAKFLNQTKANTNSTQERMPLLSLPLTISDKLPAEDVLVFVKKMMNASSCSLARSHYIFYWVLSQILVQIAPIPSLASTALEISQTQVVNLDIVLDGHLHEDKVTTLDAVAQCALASNNVALARSMFKAAADLSKILCGENSFNTQQLVTLATNTPKNTKELGLAYSNIQSANARLRYYESYEGEDEEDEEDDDEILEDN